MSKPRELKRGVTKLAEVFLKSDAFDQLFKDVMALVDETAAYLNGPGKDESKKLHHASARVYGIETMRLSTALMVMSTHVQLLREIKEGDVSLKKYLRKSMERQAKLEVQRANLKVLPERLQDLIIRCQLLVTWLQQLNRGLVAPARAQAGEAEDSVPGSIKDLKNRLRQAYS